MRRLLIAATVAVAACSSPADTSATAPSQGDPPRQSVVVHKSPTCGCCGDHAEYLAKHGFEVITQDHDDLERFKTDLGVPVDARSCHTTLIGGYVVEGHVPIEAIDELLERQPPIEGIALPGMPTGSPGMDGPKQKPFEIQAWDEDGGATTFGRY